MQNGPLRVFVVGCPRSGTTILQRILSERLGLLTLPETSFFSNLVGNPEQRMFPSTQRPTPPVRRMTSALRRQLQLSTGREWVDAETVRAPRRPKWSRWDVAASDFLAGMDQMAADAGCLGWLEKTPTHLHYLPEIGMLVPDAWFVHIVRDGQDNVASLWDAASKYAEPWKALFPTIERAVDQWNSAIGASADMVGRARHVFVPYSTVATMPEESLAQVLTKMGLDATAPVAKPGSPTAPAGLRTESEAWKADAVSSKVVPKVSKWMSALDASERTTADALINPVPGTLQAALDDFDAAVCGPITQPAPRFKEGSRA